MLTAPAFRGLFAGSFALARSNATRGQAATARFASFSQSGRERRRVDDRVAPLVERDPLRKQLGAEAVCLAGDRVDAHRPSAHDSLPRGSGSTDRPVALQRPRRWSSTSSAKHVKRARDEARRRRRGAAGAAAAHRLDPAARGRLRRSRSPGASRPSAPAIASSPWTHGPHWPALSRGEVAARRGRSRRGRRPPRAGRRSPARPSVAPSGPRRGVEQRGVDRGVDVQPAAEVAADEERRAAAPGLPARAARAARRASSRADLVHAGPGDRAAERDERRAGLVGRPELPEPLRPEAGDQREVRERLGVLDERRAPRRRARTAAAA